MQRQHHSEMESLQLLAAYQHHIRARGEDGDLFCKLGASLRAAGRLQESKRCHKRAVEILLKAVRQGNADLALHLEVSIYVNFIRPVETEEHYYRCFSEWREDMARLGRRFRSSDEHADVDPSKVAFIIMKGDMVGHTEVLLRYIRGYLQGGGEVQPCIYALQSCAPEFVVACRDAGVCLVGLREESREFATAGPASRILALRDRLRIDRIACAVWVSQPNGAIFALSVGIAPVQVFWALRFHPVSGSYIDAHLTYGAPGERLQYFGKQAWQVVPTPLAIDTPCADPDSVRQVRTRFAERFLFGTIAREDKIRSPGFLEVVVGILRAVPDAGYLWTGANRDRSIEAYFETEGVADRCHFAGWVDVPLYVSVLDAFLETFPLGCGLTGYQALGAGTPLLSYAHENTVFGMQFWTRFKAMSAGGDGSEVMDYPILCARSHDEYVALAVRLAGDAAFRDEVGTRGRQYFDHEIVLGASYADEFFAAIQEVIRAKLAITV